MPFFSTIRNFLYYLQSRYSIYIIIHSIKFLSSNVIENWGCRDSNPEAEFRNLQFEVSEHNLESSQTFLVSVWVS